MLSLGVWTETQRFFPPRGKQRQPVSGALGQTESEQSWWHCIRGYRGIKALPPWRKRRNSGKPLGPLGSLFCSSASFSSPKSVEIDFISPILLTLTDSYHWASPLGELLENEHSPNVQPPNPRENSSNFSSYIMTEPLSSVRAGEVPLDSPRSRYRHRCGHSFAHELIKRG